MNKKKIVILICVLLIITTLPVSGFKINVNENNVIIRNDYFEDYPGYMTVPYPKFNTPKISQIKSGHHKKMIYPIDDDIIDMILQLDQSMVLGYLENLTAFWPRVTGTTECYSAGDYLYNEFESMALDVRFHNWSYAGYTDRNVEATLYGTNGSDEIYVICAHFDTVPESPGADDDGSGIAAILSIANIISKYEFDYTIRFVTFSGEEEGLYGSYKYVEESYGNGDNIVGVLNADMIGYAETIEGENKITIRQNEKSIWLTDFISNVSQLYQEYINLEIIPEFDYYGYSDHYSFWQFGYDSIQYREFETNPYYHTSEDTIENMQIYYSTKCSKLALATLAELASQSYEVNIPPNAPIIDGPTSGNEGIEYTFTFNSVDQNGDNVYYYILWGDGHVEIWDGPYQSGVDFEIAHTYENQGLYTIEAKAKDVYDAESNLTYFDVQIPRSKATYNNLFYLFLGRFQIVERILGLIRNVIDFKC